MTTFLNINLNQKTPKQFVRIHVAFFLFWALGTLILCRVDNYLLACLNIYLKGWSFIVPITYLFILVKFLKKHKWFYTLGFIVYPFLIFIWFLPKLILQKGRIYLFFAYAQLLLEKIINWKKTLIRFSTLIISIVSLVITENFYVRLVTIGIFSFFYLNYLSNFIKRCFSSFISIDNLKIQKFLDHNAQSEIIDKVENGKYDEKLSQEEIKIKKLKSLLLWSFGLDYVKQNLSGFKGTRAYLLYWFSEMTLYVLLTLSYFTFLNVEIYKINNLSFTVTDAPNIFDFFYYTLKTFSFSNIDAIKPASIVSKLSEIGSFFCLAIIFLVIVCSFLYSLVTQKNKEEVQVIAKACEVENTKIELHVQNSYKTSLTKASNEINTIKDSILKLKNILETII